MKKVILGIICLLLFSNGYVVINASTKSYGYQGGNLKKAIFNQVKVTSEKNRYMTFFEDIDGDNYNEAIVYLWGPDFSGTGGDTLLIFDEKNGEYNYISKSTSINMPIIISNTKTNGYNDIVVYVVGGGIKNGYYAILKNKDERYPLNPTVQPKANITQSNVKRVLNIPITSMEGDALVR